MKKLWRFKSLLPSHRENDRVSERSRNILTRLKFTWFLLTAKHSSSNGFWETQILLESEVCRQVFCASQNAINNKIKIKDVVQVMRIFFRRNNSKKNNLLDFISFSPLLCRHFSLYLWVGAYASYVEWITENRTAVCYLRLLRHELGRSNTWAESTTAKQHHLTTPQREELCLAVWNSADAVTPNKGRSSSDLM